MLKNSRTINTSIRLRALLLSIAAVSWVGVLPIYAQSEPPGAPTVTSPIFNDKLLLDGYSNSYMAEPKDIIIAMMQDDTLDDYKMAAAVRVFRTQYSKDLFRQEKKAIEKILIRRLNRTDSIFVEVEILHTLCVIDRYKYFASMVPLLIQKIDHYNRTVNDIAFDGVNDLVKNQSRAREARIVFNTLRKNLFLSRRRLSNIKEPDTRLKHKLALLKWSIKVLGTEELERLPKEVIPLL